MSLEGNKVEKKQTPILAAVAVPHPPMILPEIGKGEEQKIAKSTDAYRKVMRRIADLRPDTIIVITPHSIMYQDYIHISPGSSANGDMGAFGAHKVKFHVDYDEQFVNELSQIAYQEKLPAGTLGEKKKMLDHGTMVPLYFLNEVYSEYKIVRIGLSGLSAIDHYHFGECIARTVERLGRCAVLIASGDLSHKLKEDGPYGFASEGLEFDRQITDAFAAGDFLTILRLSPELAEAAAECGLRSFQIMAGALDGRAITHELLSYEGTFGVGYAVALFEVTGEDANRNYREQHALIEQKQLAKIKGHEDDYVRLARISLETYIRTGEYVSLPDSLSEELLNVRAGVFVSLKKHGQLRGCIGTISPMTGSVAEEIIRNAVSAAIDDSRFDPVIEQELPELVYSVDVLGEPEAIDSPEMLDVQRYGVIVQSGGRRGLLLPNLPGVNTVEEQIVISKQKAGISAKEPVKLFRFEVVRHQ